jgi:hypothetical protein
MVARFCSRFGLTAILLFLGRPVFAQAPPPLDDFVALASKDEKVSDEAAARKKRARSITIAA